MIVNRSIAPAMLVTDGLVYAIRVLLSTNSEPMLKTTLWFLVKLTESLDTEIFTRLFLVDNLMDLLTPIAEKKVRLWFI